MFLAFSGCEHVWLRSEFVDYFGYRRPALGGNTSSNGKTYVDVLGLNDDINWVRGAHQFAFGVSAQYAQMNYYSNSYDRGQLTFSGQITVSGWPIS